MKPPGWSPRPMPPTAVTQACSSGRDSIIHPGCLSYRARVHVGDSGLHLELSFEVARNAVLHPTLDFRLGGCD